MPTLGYFIKENVLRILKNRFRSHIFRATWYIILKNSITFASTKSQRVVRKMRKVSRCEIGGDDLKD